MTYNLIFWYLY